MLSELFSQAYADALAAGVPVPSKDKINVLYNQKIGRAWGICERNYSGEWTIKLSQLLCQKTDAKSIKNTMIHELIHTAGAIGHRSAFKTYAALVNHRFDGYYHVSRFESCFEKMGAAGVMENFKHVIKCPQCGRMFGYNKTARAILHPESYICSYCEKNAHQKISLVRIK